MQDMRILHLLDRPPAIGLERIAGCVHFHAEEVRPDATTPGSALRCDCARTTWKEALREASSERTTITQVTKLVFVLEIRGLTFANFASCLSVS